MPTWKKAKLLAPARIVAFQQNAAHRPHNGEPEMKNPPEEEAAVRKFLILTSGLWKPSYSLGHFGGRCYRVTEAKVIERNCW